MSNNLTQNIIRNADEIISKQLHSSAKDKAKEHVDEFATALILQAKILAFREKAELVLSRHIDESFEFIFQKKQREWARELFKILGGALVGAFVPGLITSLPTHDIAGTIIYIVLGFIGMALVFIGLII